MDAVYSHLGIHVDEIQKAAFAIHLPIGEFVTDTHHHVRHQLLYAEGGGLHFFADEQQFILPAKHGAWIPAGLNHKVLSSSPHLYLRTLYMEQMQETVQFPQRLTIFPISPLAREMIVHTQQWHYDEAVTDAETAFYNAIGYLIADWCADDITLVLPTTEHAHLMQITQYMLANLDQNLSTSQVSYEFGLSTRTLMRLFRNQFDMTFQTYLRTARIIKALELLSMPDVSITDVSLQVGYQSMSSFSNTFKSYVGKSPSMFRQEILNS